MKKHLIIRITGNLQGTLFRQEARQKAESMGLKGYAKDEIDGTLLIEVEGDPEQVDAYREWCHTGPEGTSVSRVHSEQGQPQGYDRFMEKI